MDDAYLRVDQPRPLQESVEHGHDGAGLPAGKPAEGLLRIHAPAVRDRQHGGGGSGQEGRLLVGKGDGHDVGGAYAGVDAAEVHLAEVASIVAQHFMQAVVSDKHKIGACGLLPENGLLVAAGGCGHHSRRDAEIPLGAGKAGP